MTAYYTDYVSINRPGDLDLDFLISKQAHGSPDIILRKTPNPTYIILFYLLSFILSLILIQLLALGCNVK